MRLCLWLGVLSATLVVAGCSSTPAPLEPPRTTDATQGSGPTKVQYSSGASTQPQSAPANSKSMSAVTSSGEKDMGYRNSQTPMMPKMTTTSSQDSDLESSRPSVNLFETYNRSLPWNAGTSPVGKPVLKFGSAAERIQR